MKPENNFNYNLSQSQTGDLGYSSGSLGVQHRYGNLGASVSSSTGGSQQTGLNASGSVVLHSGGVILAPTVGDTFAIVEVLKGERQDTSLLARWAEPSEVAYPILWMASDEASFITGTTLLVEEELPKDKPQAPEPDERDTQSAQTDHHNGNKSSRKSVKADPGK